MASKDEYIRAFIVILAHPRTPPTRALWVAAKSKPTMRRHLPVLRHFLSFLDFLAFFSFFSFTALPAAPTLAFLVVPAP